jgi:hypothetical protein
MMEAPPLRKGVGGFNSQRFLLTTSQPAEVSINGKIKFGSLMKCLRCQGTMLVERQYTKVSRRFNARCVNCGFWFDLADVLRFFKRVLESGYHGHKIRETL